MSLSGSSGSGTAPKRSYHRAACRRATDAYRAVPRRPAARAPAFRLPLRAGFEGRAHPLVEHEQMLHPLALGGEAGAAIEPVRRLVWRLMCAARARTSFHESRIGPCR